MKEKKIDYPNRSALKHFEIQFSYTEKPEFPASKTNGSATVLAESFQQGVAEFFLHYPNAEIWSVIHKHRWDHNEHKVIVTNPALHRLTISHT